MGLPAITDDELVGLNAAGSRVLSSASLTRRFYDRARWLAEKKPPIHWSFGDGVDCPFVAGNLGTTGATVSETEALVGWTIGHALVPAVGNDTGSVRLYVHQQEYSSGTLRAGLRIRPSPLNDVFVRTPGQWIDLGTFSLGSTNGWRSGTFTIPADMRDGPFEAWVYLTTWNGTASSSVQTQATAWSLHSEGAAWPRASGEVLGAHFRRSGGPPDDVFTLRLLRDIQDDSAAVPRVLAHHSFAQAPAAGGNWACRYVIPAPMHDELLTVHVRCRTTSGTAAVLSGALDAIDAYVSGPPAADDTEAVASATMGWYTLTLTPTVNVPNYLYVWLDPDPADTAEIEAIYVTQADPVGNRFISGVPGYRLLPVSLRAAVAGAPIVNAYSGQFGGETPAAGESIQNLWTDRFATLNNAKWWPQTRGSVLMPGDYVVSGDSTTGAYGGVSALDLLSKITPTWASRDIVFASRLTTDDVPLEPGEQIRVEPLVEGTRLSSAGSQYAGDVANFNRNQFVQFGGGTITPGATGALQFQAGYTDANGLPAAGTTPFRVESLAVWELPPPQSANAVHQREYSAVAGTIPDNDIVTGLSDSIVVSGRALFLRMIRVHIVFTHADASQLKFTLTDGMTTRILRDFNGLAGSGTQVVSLSDDYEDDTQPTELLAAFSGVSTNNTWTLSAYDNAAGSTGTLDAWAIEFW